MVKSRTKKIKESSTDQLLKVLEERKKIPVDPETIKELERKAKISLTQKINVAIKKGILDENDVKYINAAETLEQRAKRYEIILQDKLKKQKENKEQEEIVKKLFPTVNYQEVKKLREGGELKLYEVPFENVPKRFVSAPADLMEVIDVMADEDIPYGLTSVRGWSAELQARFLGLMIDKKEGGFFMHIDVCGSRWFAKKGLTAADINIRDTTIHGLREGAYAKKYVDLANFLEVIAEDYTGLKEHIENYKKVRKEQFDESAWDHVVNITKDIANVEGMKVKGKPISEQLSEAYANHKKIVWASIGLITFVVLFILFGLPFVLSALA